MYTCERNGEKAERDWCAGLREVSLCTPCQPSLLCKIESCRCVLFLLRPARFFRRRLRQGASFARISTLLCACKLYRCQRDGGIVHECTLCVVVAVAAMLVSLNLFRFCLSFLLFCTQRFRGIPDHIFIVDILAGLFADWIPAISIVAGTLKGESSVGASMFSHECSRGTFEIKQK